MGEERLNGARNVLCGGSLLDRRGVFQGSEGRLSRTLDAVTKARKAP